MAILDEECTVMSAFNRTVTASNSDTLNIIKLLGKIQGNYSHTMKSPLQHLQQKFSDDRSCDACVFFLLSLEYITCTELQLIETSLCQGYRIQ
jgi:hypothetical protein